MRSKMRLICRSAQARSWDFERFQCVNWQCWIHSTASLTVEMLRARVMVSRGNKRLKTSIHSGNRLLIMRQASSRISIIIVPSTGYWSQVQTHDCQLKFVIEIFSLIEIVVCRYFAVCVCWLKWVYTTGQHFLILSTSCFVVGGWNETNVFSRNLSSYLLNIHKFELETV